MFKKFIKRPILSLVVSLIIILLGIVGFSRLPMTLYPDIAQPCVMVTGIYPGASAENIARSVAPIIEQAINGVENMTYMTTNVGNDGSIGINVYFKVGTDPDMAAVNVQNRVSTITSELPDEMVRAGIQTMKIQNSVIMYLSLKSKTEGHDETYLQNYLNINLVPQIKRIPGIGRITLFGAKDFSMRIWLQPDKMGLYDLSVEEVVAAIREQNIEIAAGSFGSNSQERFQYSITYRGKFSTPEEFDNIVIRSNSDGTQVYMKDVARSELGAYSYSSTVEVDRLPGVTMEITQTSGSNANEIITAIEALLEQTKSALPPGFEVVTMFSSKESLDVSIREVFSTLLLAFILVFFVVYIFLQDYRSTIIIGLCIPISVVGSFFAMNLAGFSLNLLTLFALVLSVGIVVDNATVVIELVNKKMQDGKMYARAASYSALTEITSAVVSSTLVMISVFAPVTFIEGAVGRFYQQFAITMIAALLISAIYSLTLCPALAALFMKRTKRENEGWFGNFERNYEAAFNRIFDRFTNQYVKLETRLVKRRMVFSLLFLLVGGSAVFLMVNTPKGFVPNEDDGLLLGAASMPAATSLAHTERVMIAADSILRSFQSVAHSSTVTGFDLMNGIENSSGALIVVSLKPHAEREGEKNIFKLRAQMNDALTKALPEAGFYMMKPPSLPGFGNFGGVELILQDREGNSFDAFNDVANSFAEKLRHLPQVASAVHSFDASFPRYELEIDHKMAKRLGVDIGHLALTIQTYYGSLMTSNFARFGRSYKVILQADPEMRKTPASLNKVFVTATNGGKIPVTAVVSVKESKGPISISRFNLFNSIMVNVEASDGISSGQLIAAIEQLADAELPNGYSYDWQGVAREEKESSGSTMLIFSFSLILVFLILAAQYDSFFMPIVILLSIPSALWGVFAGINMASLDNNIFVQVAILMLIGLIGKNSILIVENALQLRREGYSIVISAIKAARSRLRPILMTSLTSVLGTLPMLFAVGPSAIGNHSISAATVGGLLSGIVGGLIFTPPLFVAFRYIEEKIMK